ncbi:LLM class flavin-dependent oxidoreductase [Sporichthya polymorpha]|uniref:LLM class flavin-dependent oxidoreductase n=1 Tax=Sporichthya polymorpha TaxID=35751 RepID=UPI00035EC08C|nr:LLM class flavin-dependent oxidoreductase [Sporichthya polymorpha]
MLISCSFAPAADTPDHIALAEQLGFHRAWCYDSPAVFSDVWMTLALAAQRTSRIGLAPGVLVPHTRHVLTSAAAIATLARLAPGRVAVGIGSGFSAARLLGRTPVRWSEVESYVQTLRALLRGEEVEHEGRRLRMLHEDGVTAPRPLEVPIVVAAEGPRGLEAARRVGDGVSSSLMDPPAGFDWSLRVALGTVLAEGELPTSPRVVDVAGPAAALAYHGMYDFGWLEALEGLPNGRAWRERVEAVPAPARHLTIHEGHAHTLNAIDRELIPAEFIAAATFTGTADELRKRLDDLESAGVTEVSFHIAHRDAPRELEAFAALMR